MWTYVETQTLETGYLFPPKTDMDGDLGTSYKVQGPAHQKSLERRNQSGDVSRPTLGRPSGKPSSGSLERSLEPVLLQRDTLPPPGPFLPPALSASAGVHSKPWQQ